MIDTRAALRRVMSLPGLILLCLWLYVLSPLVIDATRRPEYWLRVNSVDVLPAPAGTSPAMVVDRQIIRPVLGEWNVIIRRKLPSGGWRIVCTARGTVNYKTDNELPADLDLDWWTNGQCKPLEPGIHQVASIWTLYPSGGVTRRLVVESNEFEVTQ